LQINIKYNVNDGVNHHRRYRERLRQRALPPTATAKNAKFKRPTAKRRPATTSAIFSPSAARIKNARKRRQRRRPPMRRRGMATRPKKRGRVGRTR
jgi:hypothetical protein